MHGTVEDSDRCQTEQDLFSSLTTEKKTNVSPWSRATFFVARAEVIPELSYVRVIFREERSVTSSALKTSQANESDATHSGVQLSDLPLSPGGQVSSTLVALPM